MKNHGLATPQVLLPNKRINLKKWAVVACDQYNASEEYWDRVERFVGNHASSLHLILPEIYLEDHREDRIADITYEMEEYVANGIVEALPEGFVLVQRTLKNGVRTGLVANIDLEKYSFRPTKNARIRPTEDTVMERIPPRVEIRKPALLETPHALVLLNDPRKKVIEPLVVRARNFPVLYDFELMENGGRITGRFVGDAKEIAEVYERLDMIAEENEILFAVGDGNHSLATAKTVWDEVKQNLSNAERKTHPKRFALVEVVNLYDEGLIFEPIHRVVFGVDTNALIGDLIRLFNRRQMEAKVYYKRSTAARFVNRVGNQSIDFVAKDKKGYLQLSHPLHEMEVVNFQTVLDEYLAMHPEVKVEYIHGRGELDRLCEAANTTGFVLPALVKESFIDVLTKHGVLPKKCFSLGEANEKRYYLEARLLDEVMEVDENEAILARMEAAGEAPVLIREEKEAWIDKGNNEDIIALAFAEDDEFEEPEVGINEFLDAEPPEPKAEDYLTRKEIKKLKLQKRLDEMVGEEKSDVDGIIDEMDDALVDAVGEPGLTRRERRLLKRQQEYELLLAEMDRISKEQKEGGEEAPVRRTAVKAPEKITPAKTETAVDAGDEPEESRPLSRREEKAKKRREEYEALMAEIEAETDTAQATIVSAETDQPEDIQELPLTKKELRALRRQEKYEALLHEIGLESTEEPKDEEEQEPQPSKKEMRAQRRREKQEALLAETGLLDEEPKETAEPEPEQPKAEETAKAPQGAIKTKARRIPRAVAEALEEAPLEEIPDVSVYSLERARIRLEEERLKLERYKVREESRLKLQLEREKQKAVRRMEKQAELDELETLLKERTGSDAADDKKAEAEPAAKKRRALSEVLEEVVSEVKRNETARKETEKVIVRRETSEIIGRRVSVETPEPKKRGKRRRGTLVVKRAVNEYAGEKAADEE